MRKKDGSFYTKNAIVTLRYGLQKHFMKTCGFDIINDTRFCSANEMFAAVLIKLKKEGKGNVQHKQPMSSEDFHKLYASSILSTDNPKGLQNKVFVDIMVYLCNRGRENLREMNRTDFGIATDSSGSRYVFMSHDKLTKNHRGDIADENSQQGRMYEVPGATNCPVMSFEKYIAKLNPDVDAFWQKPKAKPADSDNCWYYQIALGKNVLGDKMKTLSVAANLSKTYTNHCLRATCITALDQAGFEARHIMTVSGQKSEASIRSYSRHVSDSKKQNMSRVLSGHMIDLPAPSCSSAVALTMSQAETHSASDDCLTASQLELSLNVPDLLHTDHTDKTHPATYNFHGCNVTINNN